MDEKLKNNILDVSHNHYKYLMSLENVNGIGLGTKWISSINTFEPCIHVLVNQKLDSKYLSSNNLIPKTFMGIKTDVIKTGIFNPYSFKTYSETNEDGKITEKYRPLQGGCKILIETNDGEYDGTLGCIVTKVENGTREFFILSNNHVLASLNEAPIGTLIIQNDISTFKLEDGDIIATLANFIPLNFTTGKEEKINYVDCAIAKILDPSIISNLIIDIGEIKGISHAVLNEKVKKVGFRTGLTEGNIITIGSTEKIIVSDEISVIFKDQILCDLISDHGDSGAIALNSDNKVIGLLVGDTLEKKIMLNDINIVLDKLKVEIYTE